MNRLGHGALVLALAALSGCASVPRASGPVVAVSEAERLQAAREQALRSQVDWGLAGRVAVSNGAQGGSARLEWQQHGSAFDVTLSAPITRQSWRLVGGAGSARLEGLPGGTRQGASAADLLHDATGWTVPVESLASWVRGMRASGSTATVDFAGGTRPARISQDGWTIDYTWPADVSPTALPTRIDARRDPARVRLVVDRWTDGSASP